MRVTWGSHGVTLGTLGLPWVYHGGANDYDYYYDHDYVYDYGLDYDDDYD